MKNLFYVAGFLAIVYCLGGCKGKSPGGAAQGDTVLCPATPVVKKTLNGFGYDYANQMINDYCRNFNSGVSGYPVKPVHAWYSIDQIQKMYNLLMCESKVNGVRFYLGSETPGNPNDVKYHIFLLTTYEDHGSGTGQSGCGTVTKQSINRDYYGHNANYLVGSDPPFGDALPRNPTQAISDGARLYDAAHNPTEKPCTTRKSEHYLDAAVAHGWVLKRAINNDVSGFNTKSEWFDACFIKAVFHTILANQSSPTNLSGLRIYLGKGYKDETGMDRDVFILVPTKVEQVPGSNATIHADYYDCLEKLNPQEFNKCVTPLAATGRSENGILPDTNQSHILKHIEKYGYWYGGYDNGEMCPNSCN
jgi:hypothetical protein